MALVGPSGCGKTTVLNVLAGQSPPTTGRVRLAGKTAKGLPPALGYISQADTLLPWRTVLDNVALAMELRGIPQTPAPGDRPGPDGKKWGWQALRTTIPGSSPAA